MSCPSSKIIAATIVAASAFAAAAPSVRAGAPFSEYSCEELWIERNGIYANNGFCFTSPRAIARFGKGCKPPFGKLSGAEKARASELRRWERKKSCPAD